MDILNRIKDYIQQLFGVFEVPYEQSVVATDGNSITGQVTSAVSNSVDKIKGIYSDAYEGISTGMPDNFSMGVKQRQPSKHRIPNHFAITAPADSVTHI